MRCLSCLQRAAWVMCGVLLFGAAAFADVAEYLSEKEKLGDRHARSGELYKAYRELLAQVADAASAERIAPQLAAAADAIVQQGREFEETAPAYARAEQNLRAMPSRSPDDVARLQEVEQKFDKMVGVYLGAKHSVAKEEERIAKIQGLSRGFWNAFLMADLRITAGYRNPNRKRPWTSYADFVDLAQKYGVDKTAKLVTKGTSQEDVDAAKAALSKALGAQVEVLATSSGVRADHILFVAPVGRIADVVGAIKYGTVSDVDENRRRLVWDVPKASPVAPTAPKAAAQAATGAAHPQAAENSNVVGGGGLQEEYARLTNALNTGNHREKQEAAQTLLLVRPKDVSDPETRKLIARGYRSLATESAGGPSAEAVRGLVIWGGKYSVPVLIDLMEKNRGRANEDVFAGLASLKDARGAEAVAKQMGNFWNHDTAVSALRKMGSVAEPILIAAAPSGNPKVSLAAVQLLGDVGGEKCMALLEKASKSRNPDVKTAAREATKKIRLRQKEGKNVDDELSDPNSPFAPAEGPPLDLLALKAKAAAQKAQSTAPQAQKEDFSNADKGDWSQVKVLKPEKPRGGRLSADPAVDAADPNWAPQAVALADSASTVDRPVAMDVVMSSEPTAVVVHQGSKDVSLARLERFNLKEAKSLGSVNVPAGSNLKCVLSPSGARALIASQMGDFYTTLRLNVLDLSGDKPKELGTWYPYAGKPRWEHELKWVQWIDDEHFATINSNLSLVVWKVEGRKAVYQIDNQGSGIAAAVSPGGKYLALSCWRGLEILSARDGELLAQLSDRASFEKGIAFRRGGQKLATVSDHGSSTYIGTQRAGQVSVYDLSSGKLEGQVASLAWNSIDWLTDELFLVAGRNVLGLGMLRPMWRYETSTEIYKQIGPWRWMLEDRKLVPIKLPHEGAIAASRSANPDDVYFVLKPGTKVSLDMKLSQEGEEIRSIIASAIERHGLVIADNQPIRFVAEDKGGQSKQKTYRKGLGGFGRKQEGDQTVNYTERSIHVRMEVDGKELWTWSRWIGPPDRLDVRPGESLQQYVDRYLSAKWTTYFEKFDIAPKVIDPQKVKPLGTSKLTSDGIE